MIPPFENNCWVEFRVHNYSAVKPNQAIPARCPRCGQFSAEYLLTGQWEQHLAELVAKYSGEGIELDLHSMDILELWGLFQRFLNKQDV